MFGGVSLGVSETRMYQVPVNVTDAERYISSKRTRSAQMSTGIITKTAFCKRIEHFRNYHLVGSVTRPRKMPTRLAAVSSGALSYIHTSIACVDELAMRLTIQPTNEA